MSAREEDPKKAGGISVETNMSHAEEPLETDAKRESIKCPSCGYSFITKTNGKCKLRTRILVFADNGNTMGICPKCRTSLKVPIVLVEKRL